MKVAYVTPQFQALFQSKAAAYNIHQVIKEVNLFSSFNYT
jgi:hypothetical protein